ncbi:hypothetical protein Hena1_01430 [Erwinia phage Hena1]|uniref:Inh N-terminal domain-containing protein n=1 Tax=Erwinia phage Hena1 TaxID=2678601 RepID=A0A6B9J9P5_9CAUD|nr:hypothetical protein HWC84_gp221 [Erwinia phage Hena1]QGZ16293.1 hypothetical protein Hena1_01430 [Erwinia phage Hena1]
MANQNYKIFPNKVELFKFFGQFNKDINVSVSARLPLNGLAIGSKMQAFRSYPEFFSALAELTGQDLDTKASTLRMGNYIVFWNKTEDDKELPGPVIFSDVPTQIKDKDGEIIAEQTIEKQPEDTNPQIEALLVEAAALNNEEDKAGSKAKLVELAAEHNIVLKGNKSFSTFLAEFEAALKA